MGLGFCLRGWVGGEYGVGVGYFFSKEGDNNSYYVEEVFGNNKLL